MVGEHIHWYLTNRCNLDCDYCFKPKFSHTENESRNVNLAHILANSSVTKVTLGGGEPTLVRNLIEVIHILKQGGKYVSLHTNGLLLDDRIISELEVDDIALPIDSTDRKTQKELRGEKFAIDQIQHVASTILKKDIRLGYHTVFTAINHQNIPEIYDLIRTNRFSYWRIYEFNDELADAGGSQKKLITRLEHIDKLRGTGTPERGYTDCLLAQFLLVEQKMKKHDDLRIQFVGRRDKSEPYAFLDNYGNVSYYMWLSGRERRVIGNIITDDYQSIQKHLQEVRNKDWEFDERTEDEFW
jgi:MoaA/NifB/PqqE/SkfB family radical SAM enzyme